MHAHSVCKIVGKHGCSTALASSHRYCKWVFVLHAFLHMCIMNMQWFFKNYITFSKLPWKAYQWNNECMMVHYWFFWCKCKFLPFYEWCYNLPMQCGNCATLLVQLLHRNPFGVSENVQYLLTVWVNMHICMMLYGKYEICHLDQCCTI